MPVEKPSSERSKIRRVLTLVGLTGALLGSCVTGALLLALRSTHGRTIKDSGMWPRDDMRRLCVLLARGRGDWDADPVVLRGRVEELNVLNSSGTHTCRATLILTVEQTLRGQYSRRGSIKLSLGASDVREFSEIKPGLEYLVLFEPIAEGTRLRNVQTGESFQVTWDGVTRVDYLLRCSEERISLFQELLELTHGSAPREH